MEENFDWRDYIYLDPNEFTEQGYRVYTETLDLLASTADGRNLIRTAYENDNAIPDNLRTMSISSETSELAGNRIIIQGNSIGNAEAIAGNGIINMPENGVHGGYFFDQDNDLQRFSSFDLLVHELFHLADPAASEERTTDFTDRFVASNYAYPDANSPFRLRDTYDNGVVPRDRRVPHPSIEPEILPIVVRQRVDELNLPEAALEYISLPEDTSRYAGVTYTPPITPQGYQPEERSR